MPRHPAVRLVALVLALAWSGSASAAGEGGSACSQGGSCASGDCADAGIDCLETEPSGGGCGCEIAREPTSRAPWIALLALAAIRRRASRRSPSPPICPGDEPPTPRRVGA